MKVVIVGGVAAGASTGARVRRLDDSAEIVILERGHYVSFANCGLPYHIGGEIPGTQQPAAPDPRKPCRLAGAWMCAPVTKSSSIDPAAKVVEVHEVGRTNYREPYDKLVLCPGAEPIRPPIPGADHPRVEVLRNIPDMDRIISELGSKRHTSRRDRWQLHRPGDDRGISHPRPGNHHGRADGPSDAVARPGDDQDPRLPRQDPRRRCPTRQPAKAIREDGAALVVELSDGSEIATDIVVLAVGVRPNAELARQAGAVTRTARGHRRRRPDAHLGARHPRRG